MGSIGQSSGCAARTVKYIANSPAKNISSLDSQMMVPTLTMLGRVSEWTRPLSKAVVVTAASFHGRGAHTRRGTGVFAQVGTYLGGVTGVLSAPGGDAAGLPPFDVGRLVVREPGRPGAGGRSGARRRALPVGGARAARPRRPVAGGPHRRLAGRRPRLDRGGHHERARDVRRDAVQRPHGPAHGALDGGAGVPRAGRPDHPRAADAAGARAGGRCSRCCTAGWSGC